MVDPAAEKVLSAKRYADLLLASARLDGDRVVITLPDGSEHAVRRRRRPRTPCPTGSAWTCASSRRPPTASFPMEMYTGMSDEDTPLFDWAGPPGTWVDLADSHWLTTASLAAIAGEHPDGAVGRPPLPADRRSSRPTADGLPGGGLAHVRGRRGPGRRC